MVRAIPARRSKPPVAPAPRRAADPSSRVRKGEATRSTVLGEALSQASVVGLRGVTIGTLATKAGLSKSGLFAHFKSKEALQLAILEEAITRFVAIVIAPSLREPRGRPRVAALLQSWKRWATSEFMPGGCVFVSAIVEIDDLEPAVRARLVEAQLDWIDTLAQAIRIACDEGHFRADIDPQQEAYELVTLVYGNHLLSRLVRDPAITSAKAHATVGLDERLERAIRRLLRAASPPR